MNRRRRIAGAAIVLGLGVLAFVAYRRAGLLNLPAVPAGLTAEEAGVGGFAAFAEQERALRGEIPAPTHALALAAEGLALARQDRPAAGLARLEEAVDLAPGDLVIGNALRMAVFRQRRAWQLGRDGGGGAFEAPPEWLQGRSVAVFRRLAASHPEPAVRLQLAAALLDEMLLTSALEEQASVAMEAVAILTELLEDPRSAGPYYLPARYARGLIYLHRPANLIWSEKIVRAIAPAEDDLAVTVAIGRKLELGSDRVRADLALALGDTFAKAGRAGQARSWWQLAGTLADLGPALATRMAWSDDEMQDRLEAVLEAERQSLDPPLSDMSRLWR